MVTIEEFGKLDLRIALVETVEPHPNADRLFVLGVRIGEEKKQIVAGIRKYYGPDEIKGKRIVVVNNLEPAVIRSVESQGMLLAAFDSETLSLVTPERWISENARVK